MFFGYTGDIRFLLVLPTTCLIDIGYMERYDILFVDKFVLQDNLLSQYLQ